MVKHLMLAFSTLILSGCSASKEFPAIPPGLDRSRVPVQNIAMTAERYHFTPEELHVKAGTLVHLEVKSINGTHGFRLGAFGIDEELNEGETRVLEFYVQEKGEYTFRCSHFCGIGHFGMNGTLVVE
jgi:cytochrome c oxidase subunit 2